MATDTLDVPAGFIPDGPVPTGFIPDTVEDGETSAAKGQRLRQELAGMRANLATGEAQNAFYERYSGLGAPIFFPREPMRQVEGLEATTKPLVPLPEAPRFPDEVPTVIVPTIAGNIPLPASFGAAMWNAVIKPTVEFAESPVGLTTAGVGTVGGPFARGVISGIYAGEIGRHIPEAVEQAGTVSVIGTPQEKLEANLGLGANVTLPLVLGASARNAPSLRTVQAIESAKRAALVLPKSVEALAETSAIQAPELPTSEVVTRPVRGTIAPTGLPKSEIIPQEIEVGTMQREPSGLQVVQQTSEQPKPQGGIPATAEVLETLPQPTIEELAINELTRSAGEEMKQLVEQEGRTVERTGEALPQGADVTEPVPLGQPKYPEIPAGTIEPKGLPKLPKAESPQATVPLGEMNIPAVPEASGLRMVADAMPETAKGGVKAVEMMLDLLPEGQLKEIAMNELTRQGVERGEALRRVEALGDAFRRAKDFSKAQAEKAAETVRTQVGEGVAAEAHPAKPMTANQLKITYDALTKALQENRLSEERPGVIAGSKLEAWANDVLKGGGLHAGPDVLAAYVVKGAALLERGITDIAKWTAEMVKEFGPQIRPYLNQIRQQSETTRAAVFNAAKQKSVETAPAASPQGTAQKEAKTGFAKVIADLSALRQRSGVKRDMSQLADAAIDTVPNNSGRAAGNELRVLTRQREGDRITDNKLARQAAVFVVQAGGSPAKLAADLAKVEGKSPEAERAIRYAQEHWQDLLPVAQRARQLLNEQIQSERNSGINTEYRENYIPQRHENIMTDSGVLFGDVGREGSTAFKKARVFDDYASAIEAGYLPRNLDIADLIEHRVRTGQRLVGKKSFAESWKSVSDPVTGEPIATDLIQRRIPRPDGTTDVQWTTPQGYRVIEPIPGVRMAIRQGYARLYDALTGTSQIANTPIGSALLKSAGFLKHKLLLLDSFHASRTMQTSLAARGSASYGKGLSLVEYSDRALSDAVERGLITRDMADWVQTPQEFTVGGEQVSMTPRQLSQLAMKNGLNVGRFGDALYSQFKGTGLLNKFTEWLFEKFTRGAMVETFISEFDRVSRANPTWDTARVARNVANNVNVIFGNLQRQSIFKNPSVRDIMQIAFLAPQWVESLTRRELRGAGQLVKVPFTGKLGTTGKTIGAGLAAYVAATQIINYINRGHSTFDNPEEGHKLDAFIPDPTGQSEGFWISPLSVFGEITHDVLRYSHTEPNLASAVMKIIGNKLGPVGRAITTFASGEDYLGDELPTTWDRAQAAGLAVVPLPIGLGPLGQEAGSRIAPGTVRPPRPGAFTRQLAGSTGLKIEPHVEDEPSIKRARQVNLYIQHWIKNARYLPKDERRDYLRDQMEKADFDRKEKAKTIREAGESGLFHYE